MWYVLLLRRTEEPYKDLWGLPGGPIGFGDFISDSVRQSVMLETGLNVKLVRHIGFINARLVTESYYNVEGLIASSPHIITNLHIHAFSALADNEDFKWTVEAKLKRFNMEEISKISKDIIPTDLLILHDQFCGLSRHAFYKDCQISNKDGKYFVSELTKY